MKFVIAAVVLLVVVYLWLDYQNFSDALRVAEACRASGGVAVDAFPGRYAIECLDGQ